MKKRLPFKKRFERELKEIGAYPQANLFEEIYKSYKTHKVSPWLKSGNFPRSTRPLKRLKRRLGW